MATINLGKVVPEKGIDYFTDADIRSLDIPKNTSDLTNDSGYITDYTETDPTVPSHVKNISQNDISKWDSKADASTIPTKTSQLTNDSKFATESYVKSEIANAQLSGGDTDIDLSGYATKDELTSKVDKVTGKSLIADSEIERLASVTNYDDTEIKNTLKNKADTSSIPTKTSQLTNDSNFITSIPSEYVTDTELNAKGYLTSVPNTYKTKTENDALYQAKGNYLTSVPSEYITETELNTKGYLTEHQDISDLARRDELHSHNNKSVLDNITQTNVTNWNNKSDFSGSYDDLTNKPTIPTKVSQLTNDSLYASESYVTNAIANAQLSGDGNEIDLSGYATKDDLINKVDKETGKSLIADSEIERLASVANYNDTEIKNTLATKANASDIPTKISQLTNDKNYLTSVPDTYKTKTENDALYQAKGDYLTSVPSEYVTDTELNAKGYLTEHQDLSEYAKTTAIPTKVSQLTNDKNYLTSVPSEYVTETELNNKGYLTSVPSTYKTKTENDALYQPKGAYLTSVPSEYITDTELNAKGYLTEHQDISNLATKDELHSHSNKTILDNITQTNVNNWNNKSDFSGSYADLTNKPTIPTKTSELTNDSKFITSIPSEYVTETELSNKGYLTEHQDLSNYALKTELHSHSNKTVLDNITSAKITSWDNKSTFSGSYNDLTNKPTIPTVPTKVSAFSNDAGYLTSIPSEYVTETELNAKGYLTKHQDISNLATKSELPTKTSQLTNDSGFLTEVELTPEQMNEIKDAVVEAQTKEFVNSIEDCVDTTKQYVLPDGYIYAYTLTEVAKGGYTNKVDTTSSDFQAGKRYNASGAITSSSIDTSTCFVSNMFAIKKGDVLRIKGVRASTSTNATAPVFVAAGLLEDGTNYNNAHNAYLGEPLGASTTEYQKCWNAYETLDDGTIEWVFAVNNNGENRLSNFNTITNTRIAGVATNGIENVIVTINEEIKEPTITKEYAWVNTGISFVPTDNEDRIVALETDVNKLKTDVEDLKVNGGNTQVVKRDVNWYAFGDSITQGYISYIKDDGTASSRYSPAANQSWVYKVAELNGYNVTNYAVGGTGYAYGNPNATTTAREQVDAVDFTNCDLVTLAWGCNDWKYNGGPVGSIDDNKDTGTTPCASLKYVIEKIQSQNPLCKIIVLTPINVCYWGNFEGNYGLSHSFSKTGTLEEFYKAIVSVCEYYGIEYIDNTHSSLFNRVNITSLLLDGVHPTPEAYVVMGTELSKKINY